MIANKALAQSSTNYQGDSIKYMFPKELIDSFMSLNSNRKCLALSVKIQLNKDNSVHGFDLEKTIIKPTYNLTYEEADEILELQPNEETELVEIHNILLDIRRKREAAGAINLESPQGIISKNNSELDFKIREVTNSTRLVSESMILYGNLIFLVMK